MPGNFVNLTVSTFTRNGYKTPVKCESYVEVKSAEDKRATGQLYSLGLEV